MGQSRLHESAMEAVLELPMACNGPAKCSRVSVHGHGVYPRMKTSDAWTTRRGQRGGDREMQRCDQGSVRTSPELGEFLDRQGIDLLNVARDGFGVVSDYPS